MQYNQNEIGSIYIPYFHLRIVQSLKGEICSRADKCAGAADSGRVASAKVERHRDL